MTLEEFLRYLNRHKYSGVPIMPMAPGGITWETYKKLAKLTSYVKFNCKFKDGKCRASRGNNSYWSACCCESCRSSVGYLKVLPTNPDDLIAIAGAFDDMGGFWDRKEGCRLPRELRSPTCLGHTCSDIRGDKRSPIHPAYKILLYFFTHWRNDVPEVRSRKQRIEFPMCDHIGTTVTVFYEDLPKIIGPIKWKKFWESHTGAVR